MLDQRLLAVILAEYGGTQTRPILKAWHEKLFVQYVAPVAILTLFIKSEFIPHCEKMRVFLLILLGPTREN